MKARYYTRIERIMQKAFYQYFAFAAVLALVAALFYGAQHHYFTAAFCAFMAVVLKAENNRKK